MINLILVDSIFMKYGDFAKLSLYVHTNNIPKVCGHERVWDCVCGGGCGYK